MKRFQVNTSSGSRMSGGRDQSLSGLTHRSWVCPMCLALWCRWRYWLWNLLGRSTTGWPDCSKFLGPSQMKRTSPCYLSCRPHKPTSHSVYHITTVKIKCNPCNIMLGCFHLVFRFIERINVTSANYLKYKYNAITKFYIHVQTYIY